MATSRPIRTAGRNGVLEMVKNTENFNKKRLKIIYFVITKNHFESNDKSYHQTHDTAMGIKMKSNYTCIVMGKLHLK